MTTKSQASASTCCVCGEPSTQSPCRDCAPDYHGTHAVCNQCGDPTRSKPRVYPAYDAHFAQRLCQTCQADHRTYAEIKGIRS